MWVGVFGVVGVLVVGYVMWAAEVERERVEAAEWAERERVEAAEWAERERVEAAERAERERVEAAERAERERVEAAERAERERVEAAEKAARAKKIGIQWINIPAGSFQMGSPSQSDEQPVHSVTLKAFAMSKTEVTVGQYRACVEAGVCAEPSSCIWTSSRGDKENHPINCVDWGQARTFAKWVGADLPTEAEWEYAARGGQGFTYAGSQNADDVAWYGSNSGAGTKRAGTKRVGTKRANGYGLHDMSGSVWEWVLDQDKGDYNGAPSDGHQAVGSIPTCRIKCDNGAARRVFRGGSWYDGADHLRVANRNSRSPGYRGDLGLRLRRTDPLTP